ncbi:uncharacterized protein ACWYII_038972 [Salvelinus alpinus]
MRLHFALRCQKDQVDRHCCEAPVFHPGDRIWLSTRNLPLHLPCRNLSPRVWGPSRSSGGSMSPVVPVPLADSVPHDTPPPPVDMEGSPAYAVRSLLNSCRFGGRIQ